MIYVDANVFLRFFVNPSTPQDQSMGLQAAALFERVREGDISITTTDAIVPEVLFIMTSQLHYGLSRAEAVGRLIPILSLDGLDFPTKSACLNAVTIWVA